MGVENLKPDPLCDWLYPCKSQIDPGVRALLAAMLERAVRDATGAVMDVWHKESVYHTRMYKQHTEADALAWIFGERSKLDDPFCFAGCCAVLNLSPNRIKKHIISLRTRHADRISYWFDLPLSPDAKGQSDIANELNGVFAKSAKNVHLIHGTERASQ